MNVPILNTNYLLRKYKRTATYEIFPSGNIETKVQSMPKKTTFAITCTSAKGIDHTIATAITIAQFGFIVRPHIAARLVKSEKHLKEILQKLEKKNISDIFVVSGDREITDGPYESSVDLLLAIDTLRYQFNSIGVAGYPEGHPKISHAVLLSALKAKQSYAQKTTMYIVTQLCFNPSTIIDWAKQIKQYGITLPIIVGIPGYYNMQKLLHFAKICGVGNSLHFLIRNPKFGLALSKQIPIRFNQEVFLKELTKNPKLKETNIRSIHIYTFNDIQNIAPN